MTEQIRTQIVPLQMRGAIEPDGLDKESRTVPITFGTETPVLMRDWNMNDGQPFFEILSFDPAHIRMDRLNAGAPVCDNHDRSSVTKQLGVVDKGWIENKKGRAIIRFSNRDDVQSVWQDVVDKILQNISVGYRVYKYELVSAGENEIPTYRAIDWEPFEITMAVVPADYTAGVRSDQAESNEVIFINHHKQTQTRTMENVETPGQNQDPKPVDVVAIRTQAAADERTRTNEITLAIRKAGIDDQAFLDKLISDGTSVDQARAMIIDKFAEADPNKGRNQVTVTGKDETVQEREALADAMLIRAMPGAIPADKVTDKARSFRGLNMIDMARTMVERAGTKTIGMTRDEILARALGTGDFPNLLGNVVNRVLLAGYNTPPQTWRRIAKPIPAADFKTITAVQFGGNIKLEKVGQSGEFKNAKLSDNGETWKVDTYGKIIPITRQAIINDDLGAFTRLATLIGQSAANLESDIMWGLIVSNGKMADGKAVFHADHKNLASVVGVPSIESLTAARAAMRKQTGLDGEKLNLMVKFIIVPPELETVADQLCSSLIVPAEVGKINVFQGKLEAIAEARLTSADAWFIAADPTQCDQLVYSYLTENDGALFTETRFGFNVDGIEVKVRKDFGGAIVDHRGLFMNVGK